MSGGRSRASADALLDASFASDNVSGASPEVMAALAACNEGAALPYGADDVTAQLREIARDHFGPRAEIHPVFNGTGANVVALQALLPRWGAAICTQQAHAANDEGGAPERLGLKLLPRPAPEGRLTAEDIRAEAGALGFVHAAQPLAVTLTQSTELGTLYAPAEIAALAEEAHSLGMGVHMDGSRLANAAAALGTTLGELTTDLGVDVLSLGGTKNGALAAEAVVVLDPDRAPGLEFIRKHSMQLASKQRFVSAQLTALFGTDLWRRNAKHANAQAARLAERLAGVEGITLARRTEVNAVFPEVPPAVAQALQGRYLAHVWDTAASGNPVLRLMCSFATTDEEIDTLAAVAEQAARRA